MLLRCLNFQLLGEVIRLVRSDHLRIGDNDSPPVEHLHRSGLARDRHQRRPSRMRSNANSCAFHCFFTSVTTVNSSDPTTIAPSRNNVRQEMASPGPKQPQLISIPLRCALTMSPKNTSSSIEHATVATRIQRPAINSTPISNSTQGN